MLLRCETGDGLGHAVLGHHDGVDSWTVNVAADPGGGRQLFVSRHEAAHHRLHSSTPWGLAALAAGVPDAGGAVAPAAWLALLDACRTVHEAYATYAAVRQVPGSLELLADNLAYLAYLREAQHIADTVSDEPGAADRAVDVLLRCAMSPASLAGLAVADLRSADRIRELATADGPDARLGRIARALRDPRLLAAVRDGLGADDRATVRLDAIAAALHGAGVPTMPAAVHRDWTDRIVAELDAVSPGRFAVETAGRGDRLTGLLDDQQRERVQLHDRPLPLRIVEPAPDGRFPATEFARTADDLGPHIWVAWLHPSFLRRQFHAPPGLGDGPALGFLSCDRTDGDAHGSWLPMPALPPGVAARALARSKGVAPLLFTTLRTLDATGPDADFRGFEPVFVLVDSDLVAFLARSADDGGGGLAWTVVGSTGGRTVDVLAFERPAAPGVVYVFVCTAPTGHLAAAWLLDRPGRCDRDDSRFVLYRPALWALVEHLIGTFWMLDLYGWQDRPAPGSAVHAGTTG